MSRKLPPQYLMLALIALVVLVPVFFAGSYMVKKHMEVTNRLDELEPRYARIEGLQQRATELTQQTEQARQVLQRYIYTANQDASQVGNDAQGRVRDFFTKAGLLVVSSQVLPAKQEDMFDRIPISVRTEGDIVSLQAALAELGKLVPTIVVNALNVQSVAGGAGKTDQPQKLAAQFDLFVLRARP